MMYSVRSIALALLLLPALTVQAGGDKVRIEGAWARATAPGQEVGAGYMKLTSREDLTLIKVESPAAEFVEIHKMSMHNGVMEMRMLEELKLPAGQTVKLEPGGFHLMLIDLKKPLQDGASVEFTLHLKDAGGKTSLQGVSVPVSKSRPE
ncbi:MAG: copper chaperone PCu(A)C [Methylobacterium sp.]|nr:copper chaperone PCu(A)C [Methylobacterium sp.]